ncbi:MAG: hypothetical protein HY088_08035 [Ignavibacteriales bacterium]|nr:hypothetical protein [Ignavibacteriales bacterium]
MKSMPCAYILPLFFFLPSLFAQAQQENLQGDALSFSFSKGYGQVEVGGRFAGLEFHNSRPLPSRISFFYPVANSIDLSKDYWRRAESRPMAIGLKIGGGERHWIGDEPWEYTLSPHTVSFRKRDSVIEHELTYEFCLTQPAFVVTYTLRNLLNSELPLEVYTHLIPDLRTCQTYARKDSAWTDYNGTTNALIAYFDDPETNRATVFVQNVGAMPSLWTSSAAEINPQNNGTSEWLSSGGERWKNTLLPQSGKGKSVAAFMYRQVVKPLGLIKIVQVIGSCRPQEVQALLAMLQSSCSQEVVRYDDFVRRKTERIDAFHTGDSRLDRSAVWARGILAANAHYLDGAIVPMPCPAEYNFFFTHDMLLTDLAAVNFDLDRVKKDLLYLAAHAKEQIIPHAYYWKDDGFKTEYCAPDNWNHLWFILVAAGYLRHSLDDSTALSLYPLVTKSVDALLTQHKKDDLMYAKHPDWWDIGNREGPRAYLTILTIRALREYLFFSSYVGKRSSKLLSLEQLADRMQSALTAKLWDEEASYLINFNQEDQDKHFYAGSLLAPVYNVLDQARSRRLVETASRELVDNRIGVRTVAPADFHQDSVITYFKLVGKEGGDAYVYINGGVWTHSTAWYILALQSIGKLDKAVDFFKRTMTLDGIAQSPLGQPAMYEYRFADLFSPEHGKVDKPSFLWAAGFYLNVLYKLFAVEENEWNISAPAVKPALYDSIRYTLSFGSTKEVIIDGKGTKFSSLTFDGKAIPSRVLPLNTANAKQGRVQFGTPPDPYLDQINAIVNAVQYEADKHVLHCTVSSFEGHRVKVSVVAKSKVKRIEVNGNPVLEIDHAAHGGGTFRSSITFAGSDVVQKLSFFF